MKKWLTTDEVRALMIERAGENRFAWAVANGLSPSYVTEVVNGRRDPGKSILDVLGLKRVTRYEKTE